MNDTRHSIIPAVWTILRNEQGQIFLLRRHNTGWRDGWWTVPAGHVDKDESPTFAALRELKEEAGIIVRPDDLSEPLVHFYPADDRLHERVSLFFEVAGTQYAPVNAEPHKADRGEWFDPDALPEKIVPLLRRALLDLSAGVRYSERYYDADKYPELLQ
ncbi:MAG: NUDIX domain-containing protein [Patescibacteria group bacterium]